MDAISILTGLIVAVCLGSLWLSPRARSIATFYSGVSDDGRAPDLLTLTLSQVTTWIFARSLLNAAILGFYYGIAGTLAYAAYYLSFLTGGLIVDRIRFRDGYDSIQDFLRARFGTLGPTLYNIVVALRLASEVFANLLVVGLIFGLAGTIGYIASIVAIALVVLVYSMMGGLNASLRTDVFQMALFLIALAILTVVTSTQSGFAFTSLLETSPDPTGPGWVLLIVALLQIWSYPVHDPVMMHRGFIAGRRTTALSFIHSAWLGTACIALFGLLGVYAGINKVGDEALIPALTRLLGDGAMIVLNAALIVSAFSTLDSTLSSAAKLTVVEMGLAKQPTLGAGRVAMAAFMVLGLVFLFLGSKNLFTAVAVSGVASLFLAPVVFFCVFGRLQVPAWSLAVAFAFSLTGSVLYFIEEAGYTSVVGALSGLDQKYSKLLLITVVVLAGGMVAFAIGAMTRLGQKAEETASP